MASRPLRRRLVAAGLAASTTLAGATALAGPAHAAGDSDHASGLNTGQRHLAPAHADDGATRLGDLPRKGRYAFLLKLKTASTGSRFATVRRSTGLAAAKSAAKSQLKTVASAQSAVVGSLPSLTGTTKVLFRTHAAMAGLAVVTDVRNAHALASLPGVAAVYPIAPKQADNAYAVPLQGAPAAWTGVSGSTGQGVVVADIDTGLDYTHANFGGPGTVAAYDTANAADTQAPAADSYDPKKFDAADSYDLVGDDYNADPTSDSYDPTTKPDPNPLDCAAADGGEGHGSHTAGSIAGYGVKGNGTTYDGPYDTSTPFDSMKIGPGMAPKATLISYRVFGCVGSTDVVSAAIDRALDPNQDGDTSDHVDVINMSLGSDFGSPYDGDAVESDLAASLGVTLSISMGNSYDVYDVGGSPGTATRAITVAASVDAESVVDGTQVSFDGTAQDPIASERSIAYDWATKPDLSGTVAIPQDDTTGCAAFTGADAAAIAGHIALLTWHDKNPAGIDGCGSVARGANVRAAGGVGFIFASDQRTFSAGITGDTDIPGVLVDKDGGQSIRDAIAAGKTVTVTGTSVSSVKQDYPQDNNEVTDFSSRGIRAAGDLKPDVAAVGATVFSTLPGSGSGGQNMSGTSMAAPMVAGESALILAKHPGWTPEQVKADVMNTADQNLYVDGSAQPSSPRYAPMRVGAGRIDAKTAVANTVVAYDTDTPGAVSASFGPLQVAGPTTLRKTIKVQNLGAASATYRTGYDAITAVPGVQYSVSPASVTVPAGSAATVTVTLSIPDPSALDRAADPTKADVEPTTQIPTSTLAEASGNVTLTPTTSGLQALRVPVYSAPRPVSDMTQSSSVWLDQAGTGTLSLKGTDLTKDDLFSIAAGVDLQAESGVAPACSTRITSGCVGVPDDKGADIKYVGSTSDAPLYGGDASKSMEYIAVTSQGAHTTAAGKVEFDVYLDVDRDGAPDLVAYTTRAADSDLFLTELVDLSTGKVVDDELTNAVAGDIDTAIFDSDTLLLPLSLSALTAYGVDAAHPEFDYGVISYTSSEASYVDAVGIDPASGAMAAALTANAYVPGISVTDADGYGPLVVDGDGAELRVTQNAASYADEGGLGVLMLHLHNRVGDKAQVVQVADADDPAKPQLSLSAAPGTVAWGSPTRLTVTASGPEGAPAPDGSVTVVDLTHNTTVGTGSLTNGTATISYTPTAGAIGAASLQAVYPGHGSYAKATSATVRLTVSKAAKPVALSVAPTTVARGRRATVTVSVPSVAGGPRPTGRVTLLAGGRAVASGALGSIGAVALPYVSSTAGRIALTASYSGDGHYAAGSSAARTLTIGKSRSTVRLSAPRRVRHGKRATVTVRVATVAGVAPTGRVTVKLGGKRLTVVSLRRGKAVVSFTRRGKGRVTLTATYAGDGNYLRGSSRKVTVRIV